MELLGWLIWLTLELSEFNIEFQPRPAIKGHILTNLINKFSDNSGGVYVEKDNSQVAPKEASTKDEVLN